MKNKDIIKEARNNGWWLLRNGHDHDIYTNGVNTIPIPRHKEINENTARGIIRVIREGKAWKGNKE
ncbi:MAG: type II toxin-antitoxin system HicA family toxin [Butyrivibrio sp.]|jgi:mRNA interferase HicA|nr:type II toxin-antitoxin system HicA family toxin [Butyrivibrio sp.]